MAMAGEWTVTNTRIIDDTPKTDEDGNVKVEGLATGIRKRVKREGEEEEEEAMKGLFKKPRKWGRDSRQAPEDDAELDALLGNLAPTRIPKQETTENPSNDVPKKEESTPPMKQEPIEEDQSGINSITTEPRSDALAPAPVKTEDISEAEVAMPAVVFKKRKPKTIRQK
jgi:hypothetical protein